MAHEITREVAEKMIDNHNVLNSNKSFENCIIIVSFNLSNRQTLIVQYNMREQHKTYFLDEPVLNNASIRTNH